MRGSCRRGEGGGSFVGKLKRGETGSVIAESRSGLQVPEAGQALFDTSKTRE